jgi:hypothetical protein
VATPRPPELLTAAYLAITAAIALAAGPAAATWPLLAAHLVGVVLFVAILPRLPEIGVVGFARNWLPVVLLPILYLEVGHLDQLIASGYHDAVIRSIDAAIFPVDPRAALHRLAPGGAAAAYFDVGYLAFYALVPVLGLALYTTGRRTEYREVLTAILATFYTCFLCFIVFPVAGPWYARAHTSGVVDTLLTHGSSKGAAFPSSHVAVAVAVWCLAWRHVRAVFWLYLAVVPALVIGTVYGGYHYAFDALAGIVVGLAGARLAPSLTATLTALADRLVGAGRLRPVAPTPLAPPRPVSPWSAPVPARRPMPTMAEAPLSRPEPARAGASRPQWRMAPTDPTSRTPRQPTEAPG